MMRATLIALGMVMLVAPSVLAQTEAQQAATLAPGDYGYRHSDFHDAYMTLWQGGKCYCDKGGCRVTEWRIGPKGQVQVIVNREWRDVPAAARLPNAGVPPKLWEAPAHVCATPAGVIECVAIASGA